MLGVQDVYALRHKVLVEGQSQRRVAREMGLARDTVRRYLATPVPEPQQQQRTRTRPVLERVQPRLDELLEEWSERTTAKQRITGRRLHRQLREEGYKVGLSLVLERLREWRRERAEVYVPLVHRPGESAQVDSFEVTAEISGERCKALLFLMRLDLVNVRCMKGVGLAPVSQYLLARIHRSKLEGAGCRAGGEFGGCAGVRRGCAGVRRAVPERAGAARGR